MRRREVLGTLSLALGAEVLPGLVPGGQTLTLLAEAEAPPTPLFTTTEPQTAEEGTHMEKVIGIGGLFFRAKDPKALGAWYQQHLGIDPMPSAQNHQVWQQEAGQTVFGPFPETTKYFGDMSKQWMINFRVRDLKKLAAQLEAAGIAIKIDAESDPNGLFARIHDPEGNPIELWEDTTHKPQPSE